MGTDAELAGIVEATELAELEARVRRMEAAVLVGALGVRRQPDPFLVICATVCVLMLALVVAREVRRHLSKGDSGDVSDVRE